MQRPSESDPYLARLNRYGRNLDDLDAALDELRREFGAMREQIVALSQANAELTRNVNVLMRLAALAPRRGEREVQSS
jgi:prefoldin subunit 5